MKLNRILKYAAVSALAFSTGLTTVSCTDDFETLNTDQYEVDPNTLPFSAQFKEPLSYVYAPQQNLFQYCFSLNVVFVEVCTRMFICTYSIIHVV